jgi:hypothetical protein
MIRPLKSVPVPTSVDPDDVSAVTRGPAVGTCVIWLNAGSTIGFNGDPEEVAAEIAAYQRGEEWEKPTRKGPRPPGSNGLITP